MAPRSRADAVGGLGRDPASTRLTLRRSIEKVGSMLEAGFFQFPAFSLHLREITGRPSSLRRNDVDRLLGGRRVLDFPALHPGLQAGEVEIHHGRRVERE